MGDKLVCVGGPADGGFRSLPESEMFITIPTGPAGVAGFEAAIYHREKLSVADGAVEFLRFGGMSSIDAVKKLLEDHRP